MVPIEDMPGDGIISRNHNEVSKRQLHPQDVMKVTGVLVERRQVQKVEDLASAGPDAMLQVRTSAHLAEYTRERSVTAYLQCLSMYLLAHVLNGLNRVDPQPRVPERADTDPTLYWQFPLSFAIAYVNRARAFAASFAPGAAFAALKQQDEDERKEWIGPAPHVRPPVTGTRGLGGVRRERQALEAAGRCQGRQFSQRLRRSG